MGTAVSIEWLKLRRSRAVIVATAILVGVLPACAAGFMAAHLHGGGSQLAAKVSALVDGRGWGDYLGVVGQLSSMGAFLAVGVVTCWTYGREYSDGTVVGLFALPVGRGRIASAKAIVVLGWGLVTAVLGVVVAVVLGLPLGLDATAGAEVVQAALMPVGVAALTTLLALPLALVASAGRGYLPGIGALLGIVVVTQFVITLGAGAWFPWAAPGLWSGLGGPELAAQVTPVQLALPPLVGLLGVALTALWWQRSEVA
jgi:ABC-2 type transport system permease protein